MQPSLIDADAMFVETQNRPNVAAVIIVTKAPGGMGYDYSTASRIQESYAKAGKELGIYIFKSIQ
jgi:hypothetical protein